MRLHSINTNTKTKKLPVNKSLYHINYFLFVFFTKKLHAASKHNNHIEIWMAIYAFSYITIFMITGNVNKF